MSWKAWSPFQSLHVKLIHANMTPSERAKLQRDNLYYIVAMQVLLVLPFVFAILNKDNVYLWALFSVGVVIYLGLLPYWLRHLRQRLADTQWAKAQGLGAGEIKLFQWF